MTATDRARYDELYANTFHGPGGITNKDIQWLFDLIRRQDNIINGKTGLGKIEQTEEPGRVIPRLSFLPKETVYLYGTYPCVVVRHNSEHDNYIVTNPFESKAPDIVVEGRNLSAERE